MNDVDFGGTGLKVSRLCPACMTCGAQCEQKSRAGRWNAGDLRGNRTEVRVEIKPHKHVSYTNMSAIQTRSAAKLLAAPWLLIATIIYGIIRQY